MDTLCRVDYSSTRRVEMPGTPRYANAPGTKTPARSLAHAKPVQGPLRMWRRHRWSLILQLNMEPTSFR